MKGEKIKIDGTGLKLTNLDKKLWPQFTKGDLINYFEDMADYILPYLKNRPLSMHRFPDGVNKEGFFQKNIGDLKLPWMTTKKIKDLSTEASAKVDDDGTVTEYLVCDNKATLIYLANLACIELHPWLSRIDSLDKPDYCVLDLDPESVSFEKVKEVAKATKKVLDNLRIKAYLKTSGARGLHVFIPLGGKYSYGQSKDAAEILVHLIHKEIPEITSLARMPKKRQGKVYIDWLQNARAQTVVTPFSPRPQEGAPVSTPLAWDELDDNFKPADFNISNIKSRIEKTGDIFKPVLSESTDLKKILDKF